MKVCRTCGESKPFSAFHKRAASKDGLQAKCKECNSGAVASWAKNNPGKAAQRAQNRRAKKLAADSGCWFARAQYVDLIRTEPCSFCGTSKSEVDHIDPLTISGDDSWQNLGTACRSCNARKGTMSLLDFLLLSP